MPDNGKSIGTDTVGLGLQNGQAGRCSDGGVKGIAALAHNIDTGLRRQMVGCGAHAVDGILDKTLGGEGIGTKLKHDRFSFI